MDLYQFYMAPWRTYKAIVLVVAISILWPLYSLAESKEVSLGYFLLVYGTAWFFILFADGTSGTVIPFSYRPWFVLLGIGALVYSVILALQILG